MSKLPAPIEVISESFNRYLALIDSNSLLKLIVFSYFCYIEFVKQFFFNF